MTHHITGGILFNDCGDYGNKYSVKSSMENKPVTFISWLRAAKYVNWLHNYKGWRIYKNVTNSSTATDWVDTGIIVGNNSIVKIKASGEIEYSDIVPDIRFFVGPEGVSIPDSSCGFTELPINTNIASLVGKIDEQQAFYIGSGVQYFSESSGVLYLGINDINCASDNQGQFDVTVEIYDELTDFGTKLYSGAYDLTQIDIDKPIFRSADAKYFLPSHREWYKAAYYDHSKGKYWNYPTQSDTAPYQINNICYESFNYPIRIKCSGCKPIFNENLLCPTITSLSNNILLTSASGDSVTLSGTISGLVPGSQYLYYFDTIDNNWPCNISPQSNIFTASSGTHTIYSVFSFSDPISAYYKNTNPIKKDLANLSIKSDISKNFNDIYNILKLSVTEIDSNCVKSEKTSILKCDDC